MITMQSIAQDMRSIAAKLLNEVGPNIDLPDELTHEQARHLDMAYALLDNADELEKIQKRLVNDLSEVEFFTRDTLTVLDNGAD